MSFTVEPIWPLPWVILVIAALVTLVLVTYPRRVRHFSPGMRRTLIGLRLAAVGVLALAMLRPVLQMEKTEQQTRYLFIVADSSRSMTVNDVKGTSAGSRREALLATLADAEEELKKLGKDVEIQYFDFAETLRKPTNKLENTTDGSETNVARALKQLLSRTDGKPMLGVILMGDCAPRVTAAKSDPREQAKTAARDFGDRGVRVHTVPFGGSGWTGSAGDLAVLDVQVDSRPYEGKVVTVKATLRALRAKSAGRLKARILVESGSASGSAGKMVEAAKLKTAQPADTNIVARTHDDVIKKELSFVPTRPGLYKIAVEFTGLPDEQDRTNNVMTRIINVQAGGISVAYIDRLRTEQKFVRTVNSSEMIQLDYFYVRVGGRAGASQLDPKIFQGGENAYDVFIVGDVPARVFGEENIRALRARIDEGAGFMMTGGRDSFAAGGWARQKLIADVLPVEMNPNDEIFRAEERQTGKPSTELHHLSSLAMVPTQLGVNRIVMRMAPGGGDNLAVHKDAWLKLPRLQGANRLKVKQRANRDGQNLIEVLARMPGAEPDPDNRKPPPPPLLVFDEWTPPQKKGGDNRQTKSARVLAFAGDTTYLWYIEGHKEAHQRFWRQVILFLAQKEQEEQPVWVRIENNGKRHFGVNGSVPISFGARDAEGKAVHNLPYTIQVIGPKRKDDPSQRHEFSFDTQGGAGDNTRELRGPLDGGKWVPGEYWIKVTGYKKPKVKLLPGQKPPVHGTGWERFIVESTDLELDNPGADVELLKDIAEQTGGTYVAQPGEFKEFLKRLSVPQDDLQSMERITLWDTWPRLDDDGNSYIPGLLLLFVGLMSVEWFLRKRKGLV